MPSSRTTHATTSASPRSASRTASAARTAIVDLLKEDHKRAKKAFRDIEKLDPHEDAEEFEAVVTQTCNELRVHTALEEELLYPALHEALSEPDLIDEAEVEHMTAKNLIEQLEGMQPDDGKFIATFRVLGEYVKHHIREEETEMFPQMQRAKLDWPSMQQEIESRREALMAEYMPEEAEEAEETEEKMPADSGSRKNNRKGGNKNVRTQEKQASRDQDSLPEG